MQTCTARYTRTNGNCLLRLYFGSLSTGAQEDTRGKEMVMKVFTKEWWRQFYKKYLTQFPDFLQYIILLLGGLIMLFFL
jgi:hypothetical protein